MPGSSGGGLETIKTCVQCEVERGREEWKCGAELHKVQQLLETG